VFLTPQGHPDNILNPFSGTFQPPPDPHRQCQKNGQKARPQLGIVKILCEIYALGGQKINSGAKKNVLGPRAKTPSDF
jgi:hypothetical protein